MFVVLNIWFTHLTTGVSEVRLLSRVLTPSLTSLTCSYFPSPNIVGLALYSILRFLCMIRIFSGVNEVERKWDLMLRSYVVSSSLIYSFHMVYMKGVEHNESSPAGILSDIISSYCFSGLITQL